MKNPLQPVIVLGKGTMFRIAYNSADGWRPKRNCHFCGAVKLSYQPEEGKAAYRCQSTVSVGVWTKGGIWTVSVQCFERYHEMVARKFRKLQQSRK